MKNLELMWVCKIPNFDPTQYGLDVSHPIFLTTQEEVDAWLNENKDDGRTATAFWMCKDCYSSDNQMCSECQTEYQQKLTMRA